MAVAMAPSGGHKNFHFYDAPHCMQSRNCSTLFEPIEINLISGSKREGREQRP